MRKTMNKETKGNGGSTEMNNVMDIVDSCMKAQKDFMDSCAKAQKEGVERWTEAMGMLQKPLASMAGTQNGPMKEMLGFSSDCLTTMMNTAKAVADESGKMQEAWKGAFDTQMEMARETMQKMAVCFQPVCSQK